MLTLSRRLGESILIGDNVRVTVFSIDRNKVRLAFDAPREVPIMRAELLTSPEGSPEGKAHEA